MRNDEAGWEVAIAKSLYHDRTHPLPPSQECACVCPSCFNSAHFIMDPGDDCICPECPCNDREVSK